MRQAALTGFDLAQGSFQMAYYSELKNQSKTTKLHSSYRHRSIPEVNPIESDDKLP